MIWCADMKQQTIREIALLLTSATLLVLLLLETPVMATPQSQATAFVEDAGEDVRKGLTESTVAASSSEPERSSIDFGLEDRLISGYEDASPSVVHITNRNYMRFMGQLVPQGGSGTGFVYDREGHIVTNYHVIEDADEMVITFQDFTVYLQTRTRVGETVDMTVITDGTEREIAVTLGQQPRT